MSLRMVRARIQADQTEEMEQAVKEMFAAIDAAQPAASMAGSSLQAGGWPKTPIRSRVSSVTRSALSP
jgi:hypothetical protein